MTYILLNGRLVCILKCSGNFFFQFVNWDLFTIWIEKKELSNHTRKQNFNSHIETIKSTYWLKIYPINEMILQRREKKNIAECGTEMAVENCFDPMECFFSLMVCTPPHRLMECVKSVYNIFFLFEKKKKNKIIDTEKKPTENMCDASRR